MRFQTLLLMAGLLTPAAAAAQITVRPGQYEYTLEMDLSAMGVPKEAQDAVLGGAGFEKQKRVDCITAGEASEMKDAAGIAKLFAREAGDENCKMSDAKAAGNKLTFTTTCTDDDIRTVSTTEMTFGVDSFSGLTKAKDQDGRLSTLKWSARRVGECKE